MGTGVSLGTARRSLRPLACPDARNSLLLDLHVARLPRSTWWELAIFRLLAGFGIGGEFVGAATFVAEELPESRRVFGTGLMNSGYYVGIFIAAALNYTVGAHYGWRAMFAIGGLPALFIAYIRSSVKEPAALAAARQGNRWMEGARLLLCALLAGVPPQHDPELHLFADLDDRPLGRLRLRAGQR